MARLLSAVLCSLMLLPGNARAQDILPPGDDRPLLRLNVEGPLSYVSGLAFRRDGKTLYACGWDKVVHAWTERNGRFEYSPANVLRIPVGGGLDGGLNDIAVSPDGKWLATAGRGYARSISGARDNGWVWPAESLSAETRLDQGMIYVFHLENGQVRLLRGHNGPVQSLTFAAGGNDVPILISAADEWDPAAARQQGKMRAWNVETGALLATTAQYPIADATAPGGWRWLPFPVPLWPPQFVAWKTGPEPRDVRVAVVWGDEQPPDAPREGVVRVWDVSTGQVAAAGHARLTRSVALLPGERPRFLTGSHRTIGLWSVMSTRDGRLAGLDPRRHFEAQVELPGYYVCEAATLVPAESAGARPQLATIITKHPDLRGGESRYDYSLRLFDPASFREISEPRSLWSGVQRAPTISAAPTGRYLAAAGGSDNAILVFDATRPHVEPQRLEVPGIPVQHAVFAKNAEGQLGLLLKTRRAASPGSTTSQIAAEDRIFDISNRRVLRAARGWRPVSPDSIDWRVQPMLNNGRLWFRVFDPEGAQHVVRSEDEDASDGEIEELLDFAFCPATEHCPAALLAVASHIRGEPRLVIYNVDTGEELRWLNGHTERVTSVAFSDDGQFLVSAGQDRTVRVWSLIDLKEKTLGRRGLLRGVKVAEDEGRLRITQNRGGGLRPGDVIHGVKEPNGSRTFPSAGRFFEFVNRRRPGDRLILEVDRGGVLAEIPVDVGQAIDERKPLFTVYFDTRNEGEGWNWIGWHPLGFYDALTGAAENRLGWHFNTGDVQAPARFALAGEYREQNYRRDLLQSLLERHQPEFKERTPPQMSLFLETEDLETPSGIVEGHVVSKDYNDPSHFLARTNRLRALLEVREFPLRDVESVELFVNGELAGEFEPIAGYDGSWSADLAALDLRKGVHAISATVISRDAVPQRFPLGVPITVRIQPQAPRIVTDLKNWQTVMAEELEFTAQIDQVAEPVNATLLVRHAGQVIHRRRWEGKIEDFQINEPLKLQVGENVVEIIAGNADPLEGYEFLEEALLSRTILFAQPMLPRIARLGVAVLDAGGRSREAAADDAASVIRVETSRVSLAGQVDAPQNTTLVSVELAVVKSGDKPEYLRPSAAVADFRPNRNSVEFNERLDLVPGRHTLVVKAVDSAGGTSTSEVAIEYLPPLPSAANLRVLPRVVREAPQLARLPDGVVVEGYHDPHVKLTADFITDAPLPEGLSAALVIDGELLDAPVAIDRQSRRLSAEWSLTAGHRSKVQIRLTAGGEVKRLSDAVFVTHIRPPRVLAVELPERTRESVIPISGRVYSPLELQSVSVDLNGRSLAVGDVLTLKPVAGAEHEWEFAISAVPLDVTGEVHEIEIRASNADGACVEPLIKRIERQAPETRIDVVLENPPRDRTVYEEGFAARFRIESTVDVESVSVLLRGHRDILQRNLAAGEHEFHPTLPLKPGTNRFQVEVLTPHGRKLSETVTLNLMEPPVRLLIDKIVTLPPNPAEMVNQSTSGEVYFPNSVPSAYVTIHGRVEWPTRNDPRRQHAQTVKSWVNGFRYDVATLAADGTFRLDAVLSRRVGNVVEVELPLPRDAHQRREFELDCENPQREQRLHLLLVGMDETDPIRLKRIATDMFSGNAQLPDFPAFTEVQFWGRQRGNETMPLTGTVEAGQVISQLRQMVKVFRGRQKRQELWNEEQRRRQMLNDVVLVYYGGREFMDAEGNFTLLTSENWNARTPPVSDLNSHVLRNYLGQLPGAHLLVIDVVGDTLSEEWPPDSHLGLFRQVSAEKTPPDQRLLLTLQKALTPPGKLGTTQLKIASLIKELGNNSSRLYDYIPQAMRDLQIGPSQPE